MRNFFYGTETRRLLMRFIEIFLVSGILAVVNSVEFTNVIGIAFGSGLVASILKFVRELTIPNK